MSITHPYALYSLVSVRPAVQDWHPLYPHVGVRSGGERPVLTSVRGLLTSQLAGVDARCPEPTSWFDLESQGYGSFTSVNAVCLPVLTPPAQLTQVFRSVAMPCGP